MDILRHLIIILTTMNVKLLTESHDKLKKKSSNIVEVPPLEYRQSVGRRSADLGCHWITLGGLTVRWGRSLPADSLRWSLLLLLLLVPGP